MLLQQPNLFPNADAAAYNPRPEYALSTFKGQRVVPSEERGNAAENALLLPAVPASCATCTAGPLPPPLICTAEGAYCTPPALCPVFPDAFPASRTCCGGRGEGKEFEKRGGCAERGCGGCKSCVSLCPSECGRYGYGARCGAKHSGPFPEAEYRCAVDKSRCCAAQIVPSKCGIDNTKCCAAALCKCGLSSCAACNTLPCVVGCSGGCGGCSKCSSPCLLPCTNAKACGFTEIGYCYSTDAYPVTTYLSKSCSRCACDPFLGAQYAECTGCRADAVPLDRGDDGFHSNPYLPQPSSMTLEDKFHNQRRESAFERPSTFSNNSVGIAPFSDIVGGPLPPCGATKNSQMGWNHGMLDASGRRDRLNCQDPFLHPRTTITTPRVSRYYTLYARRTTNPVDCARLQFAVAPAGVCDPVLTILPDNMLQPPGCCYYANGCGPLNIDRGIVELRSGDAIYLTCVGEPGPFFVHLWADSSGTAGVLRQSNSVFRGWGPIRRNTDEVRRFQSNSGLRPFNTPVGSPLLRPW